MNKRTDNHSPFLPQHPILAKWNGILLIKAAERTRELFNEKLKNLDLHSKHFGILFWLSQQDAQSQVELGERMKIDRAPMVQLIDHLEKQGLVERTPHRSDRRAHAIRITDSGREIYQQALQIAANIEAEVFSSLSQAERQQLNVLLNRIMENN
ncbi:MAG: MarR family winged helix-turn-helix transcriptional regulator [Waterburya sp.]